jgi:hypothetical protein
MTRYPMFHLGTPAAEDRYRRLCAARAGFERASEEFIDAELAFKGSRSESSIDAAHARREQAYALARRYAREIDEILDQDRLRQDCLGALLHEALH